MRIQQFDVALDAGYRNVLVKGTARNFPEMERIRSPEDAVWVMEDVFGLQDRAEEYGYLICMTGRGAPIGFFEVSHGTSRPFSGSTWKAIFPRCRRCAGTCITKGFTMPACHA